MRDWSRHTSRLTINADQTGYIMVGSGCCNSIAFPLSYTLNPDGTLSAIVTGESTYTGTSFNDTIIPVGFELTISMGQSEPNGYNPASGPVLLVSSIYPDEPDFPLMVWCGDFYDLRCGA